MLEDQIIALLPVDGSPMGNITLRQNLECSKDEYDEAKRNLVEKKKIIVGKGMGGSIRLSGDTRIETLANKMLEIVKKEGATGKNVGNTFLKKELQLDGKRKEKKYWAARDLLIQRGEITVRSGRGGSVALVTHIKPINTIKQLAPNDYQIPVKEDTLWSPLCNTLEREWASYKSYGENFIILNTARQGSNPTGVWSRPDIVACVYKEYEFSQPCLEITTFEVKSYDTIDVKAVYEALSHKRCAHYSYVMFHTPHKYLEEAQKQVKKLIETAKEHGIGIITFTTPFSFDDWTIDVNPIRNAPDPEALDQFFNTQSIAVKALDKIRSWFSA